MFTWQYSCLSNLRFWGQYQKQMHYFTFVTLYQKKMHFTLVTFLMWLFFPVTFWPVAFLLTFGPITEKHPSYNASDSLCRLSRAEQRIIIRLRTGHNRLNAHLHRLKMIPSDRCSCTLSPMTVEHILQECTMLRQHRENTWPAETSSEEKLYGTLEDLHRTAAFIMASGISIWF